MFPKHFAYILKESRQQIKRNLSEKWRKVKEEFHRELNAMRKQQPKKPQMTRKGCRKETQTNGAAANIAEQKRYR